MMRNLCGVFAIWMMLSYIRWDHDWLAMIQRLTSNKQGSCSFEQISDTLYLDLLFHQVKELLEESWRCHTGEIQDCALVLTEAPIDAMIGFFFTFQMRNLLVEERWHDFFHWFRELKERNEQDCWNAEGLNVTNRIAVNWIATNKIARQSQFWYHVRTFSIKRKEKDWRLTWRWIKKSHFHFNVVELVTSIPIYRTLLWLFKHQPSSRITNKSSNHM